MNKKNKEFIESNTEFLRKYGFTSEHITKNLTEQFSSGFIRFKNKDIRIDISFSSFVDSKHINLTIGLLDKNSSFSFEEYLLFKGAKKDSYVGGQNEKDDEYIKRFFLLFQQYVNDELGEVLNGQKWLDIPKDYDGLSK